MAKKLKTIQQFGSEVLAKLKETNGLPDILENYGGNDPYNSLQEIHDIEFDITADVAYGSSEGIYVTVYADGYFAKDPEERKKTMLFYAKTLGTEQKDAEEMGRFAGRCVFVGRQCIDAHKEELMRRGYRCKKNSQDIWSLVCTSEERALKYKSEGYEVFDLYQQKYL